MAPWAESKVHARAANVHVTTAPKEVGNPKWISFWQQKEKKNNFFLSTFVCIFPGQEIMKKKRNARTSLAPVQRGKTPTGLRAICNKCAPSIRREVPSLPDLIGFSWKQ